MNAVFQPCFRRRIPNRSIIAFASFTSEVVLKNKRCDAPTDDRAVIERMMEMESRKYARPVDFRIPIRCAFKRVCVDAVGECSAVHYDVDFAGSEEVLDQLRGDASYASVRRRVFGVIRRCAEGCPVRVGSQLRITAPFPDCSYRSPEIMVRQKKSWVDSGSGSLPSE
jgi:hypothetical protein